MILSRQRKAVSPYCSAQRQLCSQPSRNSTSASEAVVEAGEGSEPRHFPFIQS